MHKRSVLVVAVLALFALAQGAVAADKADKPKKKRGKGVAGVVKSVDAGANSITITVKKKKESSDQTLKVAKNAKVVINGDAKSLADLKEGDKVRALVNEAGEAVAIHSGKKAKKDGAKPKKEKKPKAKKPAKKDAAK